VGVRAGEPDEVTEPMAWSIIDSFEQEGAQYKVVLCPR